MWLSYIKPRKMPIEPGIVVVGLEVVPCTICTDNAERDVNTRYSIRYIKSNEQMLRKESLAKKLSDHDYNSFWKEIKLMNNCKTPLPTTIDGISGEANIAELWKKHFSSLLNSVESRSHWSQRSDGNCNTTYMGLP